MKLFTYTQIKPFIKVRKSDRTPRFWQLLVLSLCCFSMLSSCQQDEISFSSEQSSAPHKTYGKQSNHYQLRKKFAIALHKAMIDNKSLRDFIKQEALKMFDGDYDVLYNYVKNKNIDNTTFKELLSKYFDNSGELSTIEQVLPALTIFVPSLPHNSFSAKDWNTAKDVPLVAIRLLDNNNTPIINSAGQSYLLGDNVIPGFPVVVVKDCERISVPEFNGYQSIKGREYSSGSGFKFKFSASIYDYINHTIEITDGTPDDLIDAWTINGKHQNIGWQRDYLYYTLSQANSTGPFINNYREFIKNFKLDGDPFAALSNVAQRSSVNSNFSDPLLQKVTYHSDGSQGSFWTDGFFEFNVYLTYDVDKDPLRKSFNAAPEDLFKIEYEKTYFPIIGDIYFVTDLHTKALPLNLEMLDWPIHNYSNEWKFNFEEQDLNVKVTNSNTYTSTYNTNFSVSDGDILKVGLKFGMSDEETHSATMTTEYTENSNNLSDEIVKFGDNIIVDEGNIQFGIFYIIINYKYYTLRRYTTGKCSFSLVPLRVQ